MTWPRNSERRLAVSFHDLAAWSRPMAERFLDLARQAGVARTTALLVPNWRHENNLAEDPPFQAWVRARQSEGHEMCLHGFAHVADEIPSANPYRWLIEHVYTAGEGEFHRLDRAAAQAKLAEGMRIFSGIGLDSSGFVAPAWLMSEGTHAAVRALGFTYTTGWHSFFLPQHHARWYAPVVVLSSRSLLRRLLSLAWVPLAYRRTRNADCLRLAVHPVDMRFPAMQALIRRILTDAASSRTVLTYHELAGLLSENAEQDKPRE